MKLIKPSYEILTPINGEQILVQIEAAARTCYKSEDKIEIKYTNDVEPDTGIYLSDAVSAKVLIPKLIS